MRAFHIAAFAGAILLTVPALAQIRRLDGYQDYKFGMTLEQAQRANPNANKINCEYVNVAFCLENLTRVGAFPARLTAQFSQNPPILTRVLLTFSVRENNDRYSCSDIGKELLNLLFAKYGSQPFVNGGTATWTFPDGGAISLSALCVASGRGLNVIAYEPSSPL